MNSLLDKYRFFVLSCNYRLEQFLCARGWWQPPKDADAIKALDREYSYIVHIKKKPNGSKSITKSLNFHFPNLLTELLHHEYQMLAWLHPHTQKKNGLYVPEPFHFGCDDKHCTLEREYLSAAVASELSADKKISLFDTAITELERIGELVAHSEAVPHRTPVEILWTSFFFFAVVCLREPAKIWETIRVFALFWSNFSLYDFFFPHYVLAHRDLTSENIFDLNGRPAIADLETAIWTEAETDLALFPRFYFLEIPLPQIISYLQSKLHRADQKRRFVRLTSYYVLQFLAISGNDRFYSEAQKYRTLLLTTIAPTFSPSRRTLYEWVNSVCLTVLAIGHQMVTFAPAQSVILCYHSIGNSGWRFATTPADFAEQVAYLNKEYALVSLADILQPDTRARAAITFDDGYQDVLENAVPVLAEFKAPYTVFVIGDTKHANRAELGNELPLLTQTEVQALIKKGATIGSHTMTHAGLATCSDEALEKEIVASKKKIETDSHTTITYFAYPRGYYTDRIIALVKKARYQAAFTVTGTKLPRNLVLETMPRISIEGSLRPEQYKVLITEVGLSFHNLTMKVLELKEALIAIRK